MIVYGLPISMHIMGWKPIASFSEGPSHNFLDQHSCGGPVALPFGNQDLATSAGDRVCIAAHRCDKAHHGPGLARPSLRDGCWNMDGKSRLDILSI